MHYIKTKTRTEIMMMYWLCTTHGSHNHSLQYMHILIFPIMQAREDDRAGNLQSAKTKGRIALGLNIAAIASWAVIILIIIIANVAR